MYDDSRAFQELNPDELRRMYEEDPVSFRVRAKEAIKAACVGKTAQQTLRLQRMQWVIDGSLRKGRTPLQRLQIMEEIFYGRVYGDEGLLTQLKGKFAEVALQLRGSEDAEKRSGKRPVPRVVPKRG